MRRRRIFILSPAHCGGQRARLLFNPNAQFELAVRMRHNTGVTIAEVFSFLSGLYFRGKVAYVNAFAHPPRASESAFVITTNRGLLPLHTNSTLDDLHAMGQGDIDLEDDAYRLPLLRDAATIADSLGPKGCAVLLGSVASAKYVDVLLEALDERLMFPEEFVGRGDMSRGGLMLRAADAKKELTYIPVTGAVRRGQRPPKLEPRRWK
jgi:hypothetical protein